MIRKYSSSFFPSKTFTRFLSFFFIWKIQRLSETPLYSFLLLLFHASFLHFPFLVQTSEHNLEQQLTTQPPGETLNPEVLRWAAVSVVGDKNAYIFSSIHHLLLVSVEWQGQQIPRPASSQEHLQVRLWGAPIQPEGQPVQMLKPPEACVNPADWAPHPSKEASFAFIGNIIN